MFKKLLIFSFFSILPFQVISETYKCVHELERFGRPGETETMIFRRDQDQDGKIYFTSPRLGPMDIFYENLSTIILIEGSPPYDYITEPQVYLFFIEKKKMEYGTVNIGIEEFRKDQPYPFGYGKCELI